MKTEIETISFATMVAKLQKPGSEILPTLTAQKCEFLHHGMGIAGEAFELAMAVENLDEPNILEEAGDYLFYLQGFCKCLVIEDVEDMYHIISITERAPTTQNLCESTNELFDHIKKLVIYNQLLPVKRSRELVMDCVDHITQILDDFKITVPLAIEGNKTKLAIRYPNFDYSDHRAKNRADKV